MQGFRNFVFLIRRSGCGDRRRSAGSRTADLVGPSCRTHESIPIREMLEIISRISAWTGGNTWADAGGLLETFRGGGACPGRGTRYKNFPRLACRSYNSLYMA